MSKLIQRCASRIKVAILIGADRGLIEAAFHEYSPQTPLIMVDPDPDYVKGGASNSLMENIVRAAQRYVAQGDTVLMALHVHRWINL